MAEPYSMRKTVGTVRYIAPRIPPVMGGRRSPAGSLGGTPHGAFGLQASDRFGLQRAVSAPHLGAPGPGLASAAQPVDGIKAFNAMQPAL
eukprot:CAMPEP_0168411500 /NCGR_PEP_ID=MMETSP0228-20121227/28232_1 /TAXON_ID=133427 /ORGANISM="Protoceratium reticulatum, Strain CCCM 535 (=CCMP 1889)" /LENGTH=89 /DNA_ID=CAMNT_0008425247 /DNA_START=59 /DNA_END=327 /DNA_ORIENTATION=-